MTPIGEANRAEAWMLASFLFNREISQENAAAMDPRVWAMAADQVLNRNVVPTLSTRKQAVEFLGQLWRGKEGNEHNAASLGV